MRLIRHGISRNHGWKSLILESDRKRIQYAPQRPAGPRIVVQATAARADASSYEYELQLTPEEVLQCLFTLPPTAIPDVIRRLAGQFNVGTVVPELLRQLAAGAIAAPRPATNDDDEELEEDTDDDTDEDDAVTA